ncbi:MAG: PEP-CTERM sorting domain-containing protein [Methylobacter sp.]|nr:PEP-CTERM sorting domain-containing protein [Methylococcales bacterium]MDD5114955.1 PEP-CTERM sorting domain-containing protein [Methylobacter sp.]
MKFKLLASSLLMAGALMGSGAASASLVLQWTLTSTFQGWIAASAGPNGGIVDQTPQPIALPVTGDGDTTFKWISDSLGFGEGTTVTFTEWEDNVTLADYYRVEFENAEGLPVGSSVNYSISTQEPEKFYWAEIDTSHVGDVAATKVVDNGSSPLSIVSIAGNATEGTFGAASTINVVDTIGANNTGVITNLINNYQTVPEPMTLALLGIGLAAFGVSRRRAMSETEGLLA